MYNVLDLSKAAFCRKAKKEYTAKGNLSTVLAIATLISLYIDKNKFQLKRCQSVNPRLKRIQSQNKIPISNIALGQHNNMFNGDEFIQEKLLFLLIFKIY